VSTQGRAVLGSIWQFLKDHDYLAVIVAIAGGAWAVFTFFAKKGEKGGSTTTVKADHGSVAAGRDITAPVTIHPDANEVVAPINEGLEKLAAQQRELATQVAREKGLRSRRSLQFLSNSAKWACAKRTFQSGLTRRRMN
jgi:hypothetical protein